MRESLEADLELQRSRVMRHAIVTIQKWVRGYQTRHRYLRKREAAILLQSQVRKMVERERFMKIKRGMILIQALQRGRMQRRVYQKVGQESNLSNKVQIIENSFGFIRKGSKKNV